MPYGSHASRTAAPAENVQTNDWDGTWEDIADMPLSRLAQEERAAKAVLQINFIAYGVHAGLKGCGEMSTQARVVVQELNLLALMQPTTQPPPPPIC